jgi:hypothetical protein
MVFSSALLPVSGKKGVNLFVHKLSHWQKTSLQQQRQKLQRKRNKILREQRRSMSLSLPVAESQIHANQSERFPDVDTA